MKKGDVEANISFPDLGGEPDAHNASTGLIEFRKIHSEYKSPCKYKFQRA